MISRYVSWLLPVACLWQAGVVLAEDLPARLDWGRPLVLSTPETGLVQQVTVKPGERVRAGQELLRLDTGGLEARLAEAGAGIREGEARLAEAERERDRTQELYDRTLLAEHELQLAHIALAEARTRLLGARARQAELRQRLLAYRVLRAPWDGRVLAVMAQPGQTVISHERPMPLLELARDGQWEARADVELPVLQRLQLGMALEVVVAGKSYPGEVHALGRQPLAGQGEPRYPLTVVFSAPVAHPLHPGLAARIRLP